MKECPRQESKNAMETRLRCTDPNCYNNEMHSHGYALFVAGHERYSPMVTEEPTCDWVTANVLTDHEFVKCTTKATHKVNDADRITNLCLAHADLYRTITKQMPEKINATN